jgi:ATP-dependent helicase/nuclease subunit A
VSDSGLLVLDSASRLRALETTQSFIVRAPAGSGKTELLIQRVLALLATVETPEEVVAITFTRKAAAEMKQRLLEALVAARGDPPEQPHKLLTYTLAKSVAGRDTERGWELVANPVRLRVQTIDSLAQWLARQLPLTLGLGAAPSVTERPDELYAAAARATLGVLESTARGDRELASHVARLLAHLDNDTERATSLLASMLAKRDQWMRHLGDHDRAALEGGLQRACERHMRRVCDLLPASVADELVGLARYAASNGGAAGPMSPCADLTALPEAAVERLDAWCALATMLLKKDGDWRARHTKSEGFPAGDNAEERRRAKPHQDRIKALLDKLRGNETLREALHEIRSLPPPRYSPDQWEIVQSIIAVLRRAAAELLVVFGETGVMDFAEVTSRAVRALGDERSSDIAIALDARIRHLLVDEFQDTSITQFQLIERLTADWTAGDGRTLFVVGDPMQSIYRFREADVGLFLRAWASGIGSVPLEALRLARNFRSQDGLVQWTNRAFERVLPQYSDIASGAVSFEPAVAVHPAASEHATVVHPLIDGSASDEASLVVRIVHSIRAESSNQTIALLVRARSHLVEIAAALQASGLRPTAVELDALATRPLIGDLLALTRALEHGADRTAWLAILRAPWCGLALEDLAAFAEGQGDWNGPALLSDPAALLRLSPDGRSRVERVAAVLMRATALKQRMPAAERVEQAWLMLGGPACLASPGERSEADEFFSHLARHEEERAGLVDTALFELSLRSLFAAPDSSADPAFHVMTIHKAKGLEFDHVIVPALAASTRRDDPQLMLWLERETEAGPELLLAPIHAGGSDKDGLVRWLDSQLQRRQRREEERLAYVAATRAKQRLHLIACVTRKSTGELEPSEGSLLGRLWPAVSQDFLQASAVEGREVGAREEAALDQSLRRLPPDWSLPELPPTVDWSGKEEPVEVGASVEFSWAGETARRVGIVVHRWLQRMGEDCLAGWDPERIVTIAPQIERALAAGGLTARELADARTRVIRALTNVVRDQRGRWILQGHPSQRGELRLSVLQGRGVRRVVLDRTFITEDGVRWIIDYKVGAHEGADVQRFLDSEQARYRGQLEMYGIALDPHARLGLYFPLVPGWREWSQPGAAAVENIGEP